MKLAGNVLNKLYEKRQFMSLVFINLIVQLGITYYFMERTNNLNVNIWILFLLQVAILFAMTAYSMPKYVKLGLFCLFSYIFGLVLSLLKKKYSPEMIKAAMQGALTIFLLMIVIGFNIGVSLGPKFGLALFFGLLILIVSRIVSILTNKGQKIVSFFGIILFSVYVLYNSNKILQRNYSGDFITASMDYYLDLIFLFKNILRAGNDE
jgi:FtsH-binding integral membrane protein